SILQISIRAILKSLGVVYPCYLVCLESYMVCLFGWAACGWRLLRITVAVNKSMLRKYKFVMRRRMLVHKYLQISSFLMLWPVVLVASGQFDRYRLSYRGECFYFNEPRLMVAVGIATCLLFYRCSKPLLKCQDPLNTRHDLFAGAAGVAVLTLYALAITLHKTGALALRPNSEYVVSCTLFLLILAVHYLPCKALKKTTMARMVHGQGAEME
ncbi:unnamed protein product, partial [Chrysoparadoxa australica]